ncbi:hypothetical protein EIN_228810 [Entamoeba invadens IP1]|uniref:Uncharacterized protein n=1 Tax=Entamoeba invadens IP1 TaxID=370355 RepID=A0A0A1U8S7_ENTIV|nr:hypothetical protein EIN_228810 [Entamoeba invadens IP1]ELP88388.1 hypothetical protein EIN_228810 [Entamoeba invadens IP1]|eukprot:XP_004255159.1 hypothetical protein EIN_228810 [Entamoeba invadens IP1]
MLLNVLCWIMVYGQPNPNCSSAFCSECENEVCTKCIDMYVLENGDCIYQEKAHCKEVNITSSLCISCIDEYQKVQGICKEQDGLCSKYSRSDCVECKKGNYQHNITTGVECFNCGGVDKYCLEFDDSKCEKCTLCQEGTVLYEGKCIFAIRDCLKYLSVDVCETCVEGKMKTPSGKCVQGTIEHCKDYVNSTHCRSCLDGFVLRKYPDNYLKIDVDSFYTYYSTQIAETKCLEYKKIEHCSKFSLTEETMCVECEEGYGIDPTYSKCELGSIEGCTTYRRSNYCEECYAGYYLELGKCMVCTESSLQKNTSCVLCKNTIKVVQGECVDTHCQNLNVVDDICVTCEEGYVVDLTKSGTCIKSGNTCIQQVEGKCIQCTTGYYLTSQFTCAQCNKNTCIHCIDSPTTCSLKTTLYQKSITTSCDSYLCSSCNSTTRICLKCWDGSSALNGKCSDISCEIGLSGECVKCSQYTKKSGVPFYYQFVPVDGRCVVDSSSSLFFTFFAIILLML